MQAKFLDRNSGSAFVLKIENLTKSFGDLKACDNINLDIPNQSLQVIMGLSGSGKSTLIRHINRLIEPTSGAMMVDGQDVLTLSQNELLEFRKNKTAMVFQKFALLPHKTVLQNVSFGLFIKKVDPVEAEKKSMYWIERAGLLGFENRYTQQLSGGMQQRVGLARALANDPNASVTDLELAIDGDNLRAIMRIRASRAVGDLKSLMFWIKAMIGHISRAPFSHGLFTLQQLKKDNIDGYATEVPKLLQRMLAELEILLDELPKRINNNEETHLLTI